MRKASSVRAWRQITIGATLAALAIAGSTGVADADVGPTAPTGQTGDVAGAPAPSATAGSKKVHKHDSSTPGNGLPTFKLTIGDAYGYHGHRYVLPRTRVEIAGQVNVELAGQSITVLIKKGAHTVHSETAKLQQRAGVSSFSFHFRTGKRGKYVVETELSPEVAALANAADKKSVSVVKTDIHRGESGVAVRLFQNKLAGLGYVVSRGGRFDDATGRALLAYRKVTGMARVESAGYQLARKLAEGRGRFHLRHPDAGRHVEVSIERQVMAFADNGKVVRVYHVSTGAPGTPTVRGTFHVYRKDWGTNAKGMVNSNYFVGGYAIHGYATVPPYNASHGCVRVPIPNAASIFAWVHMGTRVDVY